MRSRTPCCAWLISTNSEMNNASTVIMKPSMPNGGSSKGLWPNHRSENTLTPTQTSEKRILKLTNPCVGVMFGMVLGMVFQGGAVSATGSLAVGIARIFFQRVALALAEDGQHVNRGTRVL